MRGMGAENSKQFERSWAIREGDFTNGKEDKKGDRKIPRQASSVSKFCR